jgi:hypothetical protein
MSDDEANQSPRTVVSKHDLCALLDARIAEVLGPEPCSNHHVAAYAMGLSSAMLGRQPTPDHYAECSWRHFAELFACACSRD